MKKLRLTLDDLLVESFNTGAAEARSGTVRGHVQSADSTCQPIETCTCGPDCCGAVPDTGAGVGVGDAQAAMITTQQTTPEDSFGTRCYVCY